MSWLWITQLSIEGMRSLDHVELALSSPPRADGAREQDDARGSATPTVLIGPNGSGKSTIVEACELLRKAGSERPVLCELDEHHATRLVRPDPASLSSWLEDYRGLGELRAAGYEHVAFPTLESP
jgi:hypothetical protein